MQGIRIDLNGQYREIGPQVQGLGAARPEPVFRMDHFHELVEQLLQQRKPGKVLIARGPQFAASAFGALETIRSRIEQLAEAGFEVIYHADEYGVSDCYLSSACTRRVLHPLGEVNFRGLAARGVFLHDALERRGIRAEVMRRGRYKSAGDMFRSTGYDQWSRAQLETLLAGAIEHMRREIEQGSGFSSEQIEQLLTGEGLDGDAALKAGMVDQLATLADVEADWKKHKIKLQKKIKLRGKYGRGTRIAVLVFEGGIVDGENRRNPLLGQVIGDRSFIRSIREVRENKRVKGVVLRINSGGGSASASDSIVRELERLAEEKPLAVSMGPVAGSGGYWIAGAGRRLFAQATTITGSIGVIGIIFQLRDFLARHGIQADAVRYGDSADIGSAMRDLTEQERELIDTRIGGLYERFLARVARVRHTSPEKIHGVGEGRLWTGSDALQQNLIDAVGGLQAAIDFVAGELGAKRVQVAFGPRVKQPFLARMLSKNSGPGAAISLAESAAAAGAVGSVSLQSAGAVLAAAQAVHARPLLLDPVLMGLITAG